LCGRKPPPERLRLDVIGADSLAVDLDDRDQLAVTSLQLRVAVDRDRLGLEPELLGERRQLTLRALAEMAPRPLVKDDSRSTDTGLA
jgi:hypothetical protein